MHQAIEWGKSVSTIGKINHVGMAVPNIESFLEDQAVLYGEYERGPVIVNEVQKVREMFITDGKHVVELLEPFPGGSPLDGFLKKNPYGGLVHIAFDAPCLDTAIESVKSKGGRVIAGPVEDIAFDNRRIAFVYLGGQVMELIETP